LRLCSSSPEIGNEGNNGGLNYIIAFSRSKEPTINIENIKYKENIMANAKQSFKTPLSPLSWVVVRGQGKLKMNKEDNGDPANYNYTATATLTEEQANKLIPIIDDFWRKNKPKGVGKKKFDLIKKEMVKVLDADGKPKLDEDDEPIKEWTGKYTIQAKTMTQWPDGKPTNPKILGSSGKPLPEDHPAAADGIGNGTEGIIHGSLGISNYTGNEGVVFFLSGVQIKESTLQPMGSDDIQAEELEDDLEASSDEAESNIEDGPEV
jgi:hypothetical protein